MDCDERNKLVLDDGWLVRGLLREDVKAEVWPLLEQPARANDRVTLVVRLCSSPPRRRTANCSKSKPAAKHQFSHTKAQPCITLVHQTTVVSAGIPLSISDLQTVHQQSQSSLPFLE